MGCEHRNTIPRFRPEDLESTLINLLIGLLSTQARETEEFQSWTATRAAICRVTRAGSVANRRRGWRSDFLVSSRSSWTAGVFASSTLFACNDFWR